MDNYEMTCHSSSPPKSSTPPLKASGSRRPAPRTTYALHKHSARIENWRNMAIHQEPAGLSVEAIDEYIRASALCLDFRKEGGGCLGYPATLLLFCELAPSVSGTRQAQQDSEERTIFRSEPLVLRPGPFERSDQESGVLVSKWACPQCGTSARELASPGKTDHHSSSLRTAIR